MVSSIIITGGVETIIYDHLHEFVDSAEQDDIQRIFSHLRDHQPRPGLHASFLDSQLRIHRYVPPFERHGRVDDIELSERWAGRTRVEGDINRVKENSGIIQRFFYNDAIWKRAIQKIPRRDRDEYLIYVGLSPHIMVGSGREQLMAPLNGCSVYVPSRLSSTPVLLSPLSIN